MDSTLPDPTALPAAHRADGAEARERLLHAALRLFSEKGFARTSTREIAQAASVNLAAIRYYFGDKAGLYASTFTEPMGAARDVIPLISPPHLSLRQALHAYYAFFVEPLKQGELARQCLRLRIREMLEPTDQWAEEMRQDAMAPHAALLAVLRRHLDMRQDDDDLHRLAFALDGLAIHLFVARDIVEAVRPGLLGSTDAIDTWADRLTDNGLALVTTERRRRAAAARTPAAARSAIGRTAATRNRSFRAPSGAAEPAAPQRTPAGRKTRKPVP
ncbi:CerR family C-terminal domain-containing protein [Xylophilus ampelinus]|uniref:TetR family transcriptional regulator n=1 Tax=Xylophilus ampelinus TaxID=54067 RepID=A0A318T0B9_9BURK|nr:CerR family C-terminal domain-containing protein [Xylophilus ampelinus]PYE78924.1 TetR family transcriptional regulator [Xylophilus ampelinus]